MFKEILAPTSSPCHLELRSYTVREVAARNALYRNPSPTIVQLGGIRATIGLGPLSCDVDHLVFLTFTIGDNPGWIAFPGEVIQLLLEQFDSKLVETYKTSAYAALGIECVLTPLLVSLERSLGVSISVEALLQHAPDQPGEALRMGLVFDMLGIGRFSGQVRLPPEAASHLAELSNARAPAPQNQIQVDFPLVICAGATTLTVAELQSLGSGDVIMMEHNAHPHMESAIARFAGIWVFPVSLTQGSAVMGAPYQSVRTSTWGWCMEVPNHNGSLNESSIEELPVQVVFEIGRINLTLEQVKSYQIGAVIPLDRQMESAVDIVANGRRIGRGTMVRIGDSLGVEIVRISSGD